MKLNHFETPEATLAHAIDNALWEIREDLAHMEGAGAENFTEEEWGVQMEQIADIEAVRKALLPQ